MSFLDKPQQLWWRKLLFQVHVWTGIGLGLYILVVSASGSALVFREEIIAAAEQRIVSNVPGEILGFDGLKERAQAAYPDYQISWFRNRENPREAVEVWLENESDRKILLMDPVSGEFLGPKGGAVEAALQFLAYLHIFLLAGDVGVIVNGVGAAFLCLMCLTGAVIWWPGVKNWRRSLVFNPQKRWKRLNWDLHSAVGIWSLAFVAVWGITGVYFAFPEPFRNLVASFAPLDQFQPRPNVPPPSPDAAMASVSALVAAAEQATPGKVSTWIGFPHHEGETSAQIYRKDSFEPEGPLVGVVLNAYTGEVQQVRNFDGTAAGDRILRWFSYLHIGNFGGIPIKALWTVLGLAPVLLFITGSLMWWNRVGSKRWNRTRKRNASPRDGGFRTLPGGYE